ncbi:hypothetical protein DFJ73DRAFT_42203 [Zopfochytrium polystomum]|nr:hypothetical protein DFJ73DRAFT_42203 [Zopfochytrium polystomum]
MPIFLSGFSFFFLFPPTVVVAAALSPLYLSRFPPPLLLFLRPNSTFFLGEARGLHVYLLKSVSYLVLAFYASSHQRPMASLASPNLPVSIFSSNFRPRCFVTASSTFFFPQHSL